MEEKKQYYTISVYTENNVGLVNRISTIFLKRHVNLLSMTASESEIEDVYRFTILVKMTQEKVQKIVGQIEKQIEVIRAFYHTDEETISQETALYKVKSELLFNEPQIQNIIKRIIIEISKELLNTHLVVKSLMNVDENFKIVEILAENKETKKKKRISEFIEKANKGK